MTDAPVNGGKPASSRPARKDVTLKVGPFNLGVDLYSTEWKVESPRQLCIGTADSEHRPTPLTAQAATCPICTPGTTGARRAKGVRAPSGEIVAVDEKTETEALELAIQHKTEIDLRPIQTAELRSLAVSSSTTYWVVPSEGSRAMVYRWLVEQLERNRTISLIARFTPRTRTGLYELRITGDALILCELTPASMLRGCPAFPPPGDDQLSPGLEARMSEIMYAWIAGADSQEVRELACSNADFRDEALRAAAEALHRNGAERVRIARGRSSTLEDKVADRQAQELISAGLL